MTPKISNKFGYDQTAIIISYWNPKKNAPPGVFIVIW